MTTGLNLYDVQSGQAELAQQQNFAIQSAMLQAQQLGQQAAAIQQQNANMALQNAKDVVAYYGNANATLQLTQKSIAQQYEANQYQHDLLQAQYGTLLSNIQSLHQSFATDKENLTKHAYSQVGTIKSAAASQGVQAGSGSFSDIERMSVQSMKDLGSNMFRDSQNRVSQVAEQAIATQASMFLSKWQLDQSTLNSLEALKVQIW